jgi:hypothetical protein
MSVMSGSKTSPRLDQTLSSIDSSPGHDKKKKRDSRDTSLSPTFQLSRDNSMDQVLLSPFKGENFKKKLSGSPETPMVVEDNASPVAVSGANAISALMQ